MVLTVNKYIHSVTLVSVYRIYLLAANSIQEPLVGLIRRLLVANDTDWFSGIHRHGDFPQCSRGDTQHSLQQPTYAAPSLLLLAISEGVR